MLTDPPPPPPPRAAATASTAGVIDLLFAHHSTAESATALLALKELVITTEVGTVAAYQVFSSSLIPGVQVEFVVAAPADGSWAHPSAAGPSNSGVELMRIVVCDWGVYEIRGGATANTSGSGAARRLLAAGGTTPTGQPAGVQGMVYDVTTTCSAGGAGGTCPSTTASAASISCPQVPACGAGEWQLPLPSIYWPSLPPPHPTPGVPACPPACLHGCLARLQLACAPGCLWSVNFWRSQPISRAFPAPIAPCRPKAVCQSLRCQGRRHHRHLRQLPQERQMPW